MATSETEPSAVATELIAAFNAVDLARMEAVLAPDLRAFVTNADGSEDEVRGREAYLSRIEAMDPAAAQFSVEPTQPPIVAGDGLVLVMVEIRAEKGDRRLHNYAAHLLRIDGGVVSEWRMADAKPAESDRFWS